MTRAAGARRGAAALLAAACLTAAMAGTSGGLADASVRAVAASGGWTVQPTPRGADLTRIFFAVSCSARRACTAVGERFGATGDAAQAPLAERWNGRHWALQRVPGRDASLTGVSCPAARDCVAVGGGVGDLAERWNGSRWAIQSTPNPSGASQSGRQIALASVSCPRRWFCVAVGGYLDVGRNQRPLGLSWNGRSWRIIRGMPAPGFGTLTAVSCSAPDACTAVGDYSTARASSLGYAERWNGRAWRLRTLPGLRHLDVVITGISCPAARMCLAVGSAVSASAGYELAELWDGHDWSASRAAVPAGQTASPGGGLAGVSCHSARLCVAVGSFADARGGTLALAERWDGSAWKAQRTPDPAPSNTVLGAVSCPRASTCTAVGEAVFGVRTRALAERDSGE